jgi:hypothetical protein
MYSSRNRQLSLIEIYAGVRLAEIAWAVVQVVVTALLFGGFFILTALGVPGETAICLEVFVVFPGLVALMTWRLQTRGRTRTRRRPMSEVIPGMIANPPPPWFSDDRRPLWVRKGDGWVPVPTMTTEKTRAGLSMD